MASAWIDRTFAKRECDRFVATPESREQCFCGQPRLWHRPSSKAGEQHSPDAWNVALNTRTYRTDAYGSIEFEGTASADIVKFLRLDYASPPRDIVQLLIHKWHFEVPHLVVSIHGSALGQRSSHGKEFHLEPRLMKALRKGLRKIVATPGCWVFIEGHNESILQLIKEAMIKKQTAHVRAGNVIAVGHWGSLPDRQRLAGRGIHLKCHRSHPWAVKGLAFSCCQKCLLLADDGTIAKSGCETTLRRKIEYYLSERVGESDLGSGAPVICLIIGGGVDIIHTAAAYVTSVPAVPVVVCDGTGGCADLLALACRLATEKGELSENHSSLLLAEVNKHVNPSDSDMAAAIFSSIRKCLRNKSLVSTFSFSYTPAQSTSKNLDSVVLAALLHGYSESSFQEQLALTIYWSRPDLAKDHVFRSDRRISVDALHDAMKHALVHDKADFVTLLLDKGVNMKRFLTQTRLEELYNVAPANVGSRYILDMLLKTERGSSRRHVQLGDIGQIINHLMGFDYRSAYKKHRPGGNMKRQWQTPSIQPKEKRLQLPSNEKDDMFFELPHNELMIWAILTDRKKIPKLMWQREQEVLAKAVVAGKLYTALAKELESSSLIDILIMEDYRNRAEKFEARAVEALDMCYQRNSAMARSLLSCRLSNWSKQNVLSLAHSAEMWEFVAHPCCQDVITEIWLGGLTINKHASLNVLCGIVLPPTVNALCFNEQLSHATEGTGSHGIVNKAFDTNSLQDLSECDLTQISLPGGEPVSFGASHSDAFEDSADPHAALGRNTNILVRLTTFYNAPITKFWMHTIAFCFFLMMLSYTALVKMPSKPRWSELFCISYIFFLTSEMVREVSNYKYVSVSKRLRVFFDDKWNVIDVTCSLLFLTGLILRFQGDELLLIIGKAIYSIAVMIWVIRLLENLSVNRTIGYFTIVIWNMLSILFKFCVLAIIFIFAFGVPQQGLKYPKQAPTWDILKNVTMTPYFMLYGEIFADDLDGICKNSSDIDSCLPGYWLHPLLEAIYLVIGMAAIVNVYFAWINSEYQAVAAVLDKIWMYERYSLVVGYRDMLVLPPPLTFVSYFYLIANRLFKWCKGGRLQGAALSDKQLEYLRSYEEQYFLEGMQEKDKLAHATMKKKVKKTHEKMCKLDLMLSRKTTAQSLEKKSDSLVSVLPNVHDIESNLEQMLGAAQTMDKHLTVLETLAQQRLKLVCQLSDLVVGKPLSSFPLTTTGPLNGTSIHRQGTQQQRASIAGEDAAEVEQNQSSESSAGCVIDSVAIHSNDPAQSQSTEGNSSNVAACLMAGMAASPSDSSSRASFPAQLVCGSTGAQPTIVVESQGDQAEEHASTDMPTRNITISVATVTDAVASAVATSAGQVTRQSSQCSKASDDAAVIAVATATADDDDDDDAWAPEPAMMPSDEKPYVMQSFSHTLLDSYSSRSYTDLAADDNKMLLMYDDLSCNSVPFAHEGEDDANLEHYCTAEASADARLPMTALLSLPTEAHHAVRPSWLPLNLALPTCQSASAGLPGENEAMPGLPDMDIRVEEMSEDVSEDVLLRSIEENAALIIGKRLQGKMVTFAVDHGPAGDHSPAEWSLASSALIAHPLTGGESPTITVPSGDGVGSCAASDRAAVELGTTGSALPRDLAIEVLAQMQPPDANASGSVCAAMHSSLHMPKLFEGLHVSAPADDNVIMLRSTSEHSISSAAVSENSAYTETSFVTDVSSP